MSNIIDTSTATMCPNLDLAQLIYVYESKNGRDCDELRSEIMALLEKDSMAHLYRNLCLKLSWNLDEKLLQDMKDSNDSDILTIEIKLSDSLERSGDMEILDVLLEKAKHFCGTGAFHLANAVYDEIIAREKTTTARKIDAWMSKARIALFDLDMVSMKACITESKRLIEIGGDWDRRNRLKVYEAIYLIAKRDFRGSATLLLDCVATFSCNEICSYKQFMFYAVITNLMVLPRTALEKKIVKNPQVISVLR